MKISDNIHALKINFNIPLPDNKFLSRFVNVYLIVDDKVTLIDSGVQSSVPEIINYLGSIGKNLSDISTLILTHAHPDHIGGAKNIQTLSGCSITAHSADSAWIEDIELQFKNRPVPGFLTLVGDSVQVNTTLEDNDFITGEIKAIHTPGHSDGHIAIHYLKENILFCGDAIPMKGDMPIYLDPADTIKSIEKMKNMPDLKYLLSSWDSPRCGNEIRDIFDNGIDYVKTIHNLIIDERKNLNKLLPIAKSVWNKLGLPEFAFNPLFVKTVEGHLKYVGKFLIE